MRASLPLALSFLSLVAASIEQGPIIQRVNLVDRLGADPDFTLLLGLLQQARLIPTLNRLEDATLFAPTNDAIQRHRKHNAVLDTVLSLSGDDPPDNIRYQLRQHLFYHLLNYSIPILPPDFPNQRPLTLETLHYPNLPIQPPTHEPPPSPPWLPQPGGLLNGDPQRLRVSSRESASWVGVDFSGRGGVLTVKETVNASNGIIIPIDDVIPLPGNLYEEIKSHPLLSEFASILTPSLVETLSTGPHLTLFFPIDPAWSTLDAIERRYLHSGYAERDVGRLVALHSSGSGTNANGQVGWSDSWENGTIFTTVEGNQLRIGYSVNGTIQVDQSGVVQEDIYASNGVLHIVSSLLIKPDTFAINAEKYLLALNATSFVSLLRTANLSHYVDDEHDGRTWTILAPRDDVLTWSPPHYAEEEKQLGKILQYHFIPGKVAPGDLLDGTLLGTELREEGLDGGRQRLAVTVSTHNGKVENDVNGEVGFGDARVISEAVETENFIIYLVSKVLEPPSTAIEKIETSASLSTFLAAIFASSMTPRVRNEPSTTVLVPHNKGFEELGLLTSYLLLPENDARKALKHVLKHHMLNSIVYSADIDPNRTHQYQTLEGSSVSLGKLEVEASGPWNYTSRLTPVNTLTKTGVVHELRDVLLPSSLRVTIGDLVHAAQGNTMANLIVRAGLGGLLNGTLTLEDVDELDDWKRTHKRPHRGPKSSSSMTKSGEGRDAPIGWTLLCPKDNAFNHVNLTRLLSDKEALRALVLQHIIPSPPSPSFSRLPPALPISFEDDATYTTLWSPSTLHGDIVFRKIKKGNSDKDGDGNHDDDDEDALNYLIGIRGARGTTGETDFARLLNYGRTATTYASDALGARSGVLQIDRVLVPWVPDWWNAWGYAVAGGVFGGVGIIAFWFTVFYFWRRHGQEATYEPLDGEVTGEED